MKITINMDISPEEARKMMGLPNLEPMQDAMMKKAQQQMEDYFDDMSDPEAMFNRLMPMGLQVMDSYKNFYTTFMNAYANQNSETIENNNQ